MFFTSHEDERGRFLKSFNTYSRLLLLWGLFLFSSRLSAQDTCAVLPSVSITGLDSSYCIVDPIVGVITSPPGGVLSGNGIIGGTFDPALAGPGIDTITYSYTGYSTDTNIAFSPISGSGTQIPLGNDALTDTLPIGFTFNFFGADYTHFYVSSNGFMTFSNNGNNGCCVGQVLPGAATPNNLIAFAWSDLFPVGGGGMGYFTVGTAPNRRLVLNVDSIPFCCGGTPDVTAQVILYESSNVIEIHTKRVNFIASGTQGIEGPNGFVAHIYPGRNGTGIWEADSSAVRFRPNACTTIDTFMVFIDDGPPAFTFSDTCLDLDTTVQFTSNTDTLRVYNTGCDTLVVDSVINSLPEFAIDTSQFVLPPRDSIDIVVTFSPLSVGSFLDSLKFFSNIGLETICLLGEGEIAAAISVSPDSLETTIISCEDSITLPLQVMNGTAGTLEFLVTGDSALFDSTSTINFTFSGASTVHTFSSLSQLVDSVFMEITINGDYDGGSEFADLFVDGGFITTIVDGNPPNGTNIITTHAFGGPLVDGWLSDGTIEVTVDNSGAVDPGLGGTDIHQVRLFFSTVAFEPWISASPTQDTITGIDSSLVSVQFKSAGLVSGTHTTQLLFHSNDPLSPLVAIPCTLHVIGAPLLDVDTACVNFDSVQQFTSNLDTVFIINTGCDTLNVTNATTTIPEFTLDTTALEIFPGDTGQLIVTFNPNTIGSFSDTLKVFSDGGDTAICLLGFSLGSPIIGVSPDSLNVTVTGCDDTTTVQMVVSNSGLGTLNYFIPGGDSAGDNLDTLLARLNAGFTSINSIIPDRFDFTNGDFGTSISDGGDDMYDGGNRLGTNFGTFIPYSDNIVTNSTDFGTNGRYFTRKYDGLFVLAADLDNVTDFEITGNLGADGSGSVNGTILTSTVNGTTYKGFVKRVFDAFDPSVNHLIIVEDAPGISHNFSTDTDNDQHEVTGLSGSTRLYYLLYASTSGAQIGDSATQAIMDEFLEVLDLFPGWLSVSQASDTLASGDSTVVDLSFSSTGLLSGQYVFDMDIISNDPINSPYTVPCILTVLGAPILDISDSCISLDTIFEFATVTDTLELYNIGCDTLQVTNITNTLSEFSVDTTSLAIFPGDTGLVSITFSPLDSGSYSDTLLVQSNAGDTNICLFARALKSPTILTQPDTIDTTIVGCSDTITVQVKAFNTGQNNLIFDVEAIETITNPTLDSVLARLLLHSDSISNVIPNRFDFSDGITGTSIGDGGSDMYDGGNELNTNFSTNISYSNNSIIASTAFGTTGEYFTGKYTGLFVMAADIDSVTHFEITGNLGADGSGNADTARLSTSKNGVNYLGFVKRVYNAFDPSVNHLIILEDKPGLGQTFSTNTNDDQHRVSDISSHSRIYYLLYAGTGGSFITNTEAKNIMDEFLDVITGPPGWLSISPDTGNVASGDSATINIELRSTGLNSGDYEAYVLFNSNDPLQPIDSVAVFLTVDGVGELDVSDSCITIDTTMEFTSTVDTFFIYNTGCDTLQVTNITNALSEFSVDTSNFSLAFGDTMRVLVTFSPASTGLFSDSLQITTNVNDTSICLSAFARPRPIISYQPDSFNVTLSCADSITTPITIYNTGLGDLEFEIGGDTAEVLALTLGVDLGTEYPNTLAAINQHYTKYRLSEINTSVPATLDSALAGKDVLLIPEREFGSPGDFTGFATILQNFASAGGTVIFCGASAFHSAGMFNTGLFSGTHEGFSTALYTVVDTTHPIMDSVSNTFFGASASFFYDITNNDATPLVQLGSDELVAIRPIGSGNAILVGADFFSTNADLTRIISNAVRFGGSSGLPSWLNLSHSADTVVTGDSSVVSIEFNSSGLTVGTYTTTLIINSNDPLAPCDTIPVTFTVQGTPTIDLSDTCVTIDSTMEFTSRSDTITIYNTGCDTLNVTNMTFAGSVFSVDTTAHEILPDDSAEVIITFSPLSVGTFTDTLTIVNDDQDTAVCLSALAFARPIIAIDPDTIIDTLPGCCDSITQNITVYNTGGSNLIYTLSEFGQHYDSTSTTNFTTTGENTLHPFGGLTQGADTVQIEITLNGDYDGGFEFADLYVDGVFVQQIVDGDPPNGTDIVQTLTFTSPLVDTWLVDDSIAVTIDNNSSVNVGVGGTSLNQVRLSLIGTNWVNIQTLVDTVAPSDSAIASIILGGCNLAPGTYTSNISISSNDPLNPNLTVPITLVKDTLPGIPIANDTVACFGDSVPDLIAIGNSITWYDDIGLTNVVHTGDTFVTGDTAVGIHTYYVTQTIDSCEGDADTVTLTINPAPTVPAVNDTFICVGEPTPDLIASGSNIQWFSDTALSILVHTGDTFSSGDTAVGSYTYYVTDSLPACPPSPTDTVVLTINPVPVTPVIGDTSICFGEPTPDLIGSGDSLNWYDDILLTNLVHTGDTFASGDTAVGVYTYYVTETDTNSLCESIPDTVVLTIHAAPAAPTALDQQGCVGSLIPDLTAVGSNIQWYSDSALTTLVDTGGTFGTGQILVGAYIYYVTQTTNNCESQATVVTLTIDSVPAAPIAGDTIVCFGDPVPDLSAAGTNIQWYSDTGLTILEFLGSPFATGQTAPGTYTYYVTQSTNGCEGPADTVTLTINALPSIPIVNDTASCFGDPTPSLVAVGDSMRWYDDALLTNLVHIGDTFATGDTAVGSYVYYVTESNSTTGCEGPADSVTLTINNSPIAPSATDTAICFGEATPDLIASGANIRWYGDTGLTNLLHSGDTFVTGETAAGIYNYYVTDSLSSCPEGPADTATLVIHGLPIAPLALDTAICFGQLTPDLIASGSNIQWYDDGGLTSLVHTGDTFSTGETAVGVYSYYVTQTDSATGCESLADTVILTIHAIPSAPITTDTASCFGESVPDLIAFGGTGVQWYDDALLTSLVHSGDTFASGDTAAGTYTYYATQTVNGCESPADTVVLTIHAIPGAPTTSDTSICFGDTVPDLIAVGTNISWYDDFGLTNLVNSGGTFATGQTLAGVYTYYVTQSINNCESPADSSTLTIQSAPAAPLSADTAICFGDSVPDLVATGTSISWYDDALLTNLVHNGDTFVSGDTAVGVYTYYATQTVNTCEGPADTVVLTINPAPSFPTATDTTICFGETTPDLIALGTNVRWYSDTGLTNLVHSGDTFVTGLTQDSTYLFYVTDSLAGCPESAADTATLVINPIPSIPVAHDTIVCFGQPTPDLIATGTNIEWFADPNLTTLLFSGDTFSTGDTAVGAYTYYVRQTVNGCPSLADTVTLSINSIPPVPNGTDTAICFGDTVPELTASGSNLFWYSDTGLTILVNTGDTFITTDSTVGVFDYFVVDSIFGCPQSPSDTVTLTIHAIPGAPVATDTALCFGDSVPDLVAIGANVNWYNDALLTNLVHSGDSFSTGDSAAGTYTYYATQTINGCEGSADTVTLTIHGIPTAPTTSDTAICFGDSVPNLVAVGSNINWYGDELLTNLVHSGDTFATGDTTVGIHTYYVTQSVNGCESPADSASLTIHAIPVTPTSSDTAVCFGDSVPDLVALGININWYDDALLTNLVHNGDSFATGDTAAGTYTYYATQTVNGCESPADTVVLTIHAIPGAPTTSDTSNCFGDTVPDLIAVGSNINWYDDALLTNLVHNGDTFTSGDTATGAYVYYATQTLNSCESLADTVTLTIHAIPGAPIVSDTAICFGDSTPELTAIGNNINWYDDVLLTNLVHSGDSFSSGDTAIGTHTYYATQTINSCESPGDSATLTIHAIPSAPVTNDTAICFGDSVPSLQAIGSNVNWYDDALLTNLVHNGSVFTSGDTAAGTYTYYVTQTINNCEGAADSVTLTIHPIPSAPLAGDTAICFGDSVPDLVAVGSNINWYDDALLTNLVHSGDSFATGDTAIGGYTYYATQTVNGCESAADTVTLTIHGIPSAPLAEDTAICFGDQVPDLVAVGSNINWYDDVLLINLVHSGDSFATGDTAIGSYTYYATQIVNGCESLSDSASLTIHAIPSAPLANDTAICFGDVVPNLLAQGTNVNWYDDALITNLIHSGDTFVSGDTAVGIYTYYATQTINGCESQADTVELTIHAIPGAPVVADTASCLGDTVPALVTIGSNISWYDDVLLTNLVHSGDTFATGDTAVGIYTYYVTQTINGCVSLADSATLTIHAIPSAPIANDTSICFGDSVPDLIAVGSNISWYDDALLNNLVHNGDTFVSGDTAAGVYTYYATQALNGCESSADTVALTINALPLAPVGTDTSICFGDVVPDLVATGSNLNWYDDTLLTNLVHSGDSFASGDTAVGVYVYYVTQTDSVTGCESSADTVSLSINVIPIAPVGNDTAICFGDSVPSLIVMGTNINWYNDALLTNLVHSGDTLASGDTIVGTHTYFATQTINGCESSADTIELTIHSIPSMPNGSDTAICFGEATPNLIASGNMIQWYNDSLLINLVHTGDSFSSGDTAVGVYTYYVTQTINGCESPADTVTLTINAIPATPVAADTSICFGESIPDLIAVGANINWYDDALLTNLVHTGDSFSTGDTAVGVYTYYVTQTINGCESSASAVTLTINSIPVAPIVLDTSACFGDSIPALIASGLNISWYDDSLLTNLIHNGDTLITGQTAVGTYTYYVTETTNGCESLADTVTLTIVATPLAPIAIDTSVCFGDTIPDLVATGSNVLWYSDTGLLNLLHTGDTFATGQTAVGTYTYYITQTVNGCESEIDSSSLTINAIPVAPLANDTAICFGDSVPDLIAIGNQIQWYDDTALTSLVSSNDTFSTGQTAIGVYLYYVTQTINGCESPADTVSLTIAAPVAAPIALDSSICFGDTVPDLFALGAGIRWYSDTLLDTLVHVGDTFATGQTLPGSYNYYVTQTVNGCESSPDTAILNIYSIPSAPIAVDEITCEGAVIPSLNAFGMNLNWYDDTLLTNNVFSGTPFSTGQTAAGVYDYYVTQMINGCESPADTGTLIISTPVGPPVASDTAICFGDTVPELLATGSGVQWYDDPFMINVLDTGNIYQPTVTDIGTFTFYATQTSGGCESDADTVQLTINPNPLVTLNKYNFLINAGDTVMIVAFNAQTYVWTPAIGLDTTQGDTVFASPGATQSYTVTGTSSDGCSSDATAIVEVIPLGIIEHNGPIQYVSIYPNPNRGVFTVEWQTREIGSMKVELRNAHGQVVMEELWSVTGNPQTQSLDFGRLAQGVYHFNMITDKGMVSRRVIVH